MPRVKASFSEDEDAIYTSWQCHIFAIALHRLTGLPLGSIAQREPVPEKDRVFPDGEPLYYELHAHAVVLLGGGLYADVDGIHLFDANESLSWFAGTGNLPELIHYGDDEDALEERYPDDVALYLNQAIRDVDEWDCYSLALHYHHLYQAGKLDIDTLCAPEKKAG